MGGQLINCCYTQIAVVWVAQGWSQMKTLAAILTSSSIRSPSKEMGRVLSQTLNSLVVVARSLADACGSKEASSRTLREACTRGLCPRLLLCFVWGGQGWLVIAFAPFPVGIFNSGVGGTLHTMREDPIDEAITASSRRRKGRGCKLDCSANTNTP